MAWFPGHLMNVAHKLDLSANQIRSLPWSTLKKVRKSGGGGGGREGEEREEEGDKGDGRDTSRTTKWSSSPDTS